MTDNVNISYSFQTGQTAQPPVDDSLVAFSGCELVRVDDAMTLVINRQNGQQQLLAPGLVDALTYCTQFRTLDAHAAWLASNRPELQGNVAAARSTLQQLDQAGLLLRANDVCRRFSETAPAAAAPTRAFIITCDRPDAVERLLE